MIERSRGRVAFCAAVAALALSAAATPAAAIPPPDEDPFYDAPRGLKSERPGTILRSRAVQITGLGIPLPFRSWQLLYRSSDSKGRPVAIVGTLVVPLTPYAGARPLISYQMAIDSLAPECNPSYTMRTGTQKETATAALGLLRGWAVMVPDFEGPRDAYGAGPMAGHATLDGIRAAHRFKPAGLAGRSTPTGMVGYSGGGQATAWAAELAPSYAPELRLAGVAEGGVPPDLVPVARQVDGGPFAGAYFGVSVGLDREFKELRLRRLLNDRGKQLVKRISEQCAELVTDYPFQRISDYTEVEDPLEVPRVRRVIAKNRLGKDTPTAPLYVWHTALDELIPVAGPDGLVDEYCREGAQVFYERSALGEHVTYAIIGAPGALQYLAERFAGRPVPTNC